MDVVAKIKQKTEEFNKLQARGLEFQQEIKTITEEANAKIKEISSKVNAINVELNRLQGEYRVLAEMGKDQGILNEEGKLIEEEKVEEVKAEE